MNVPAMSEKNNVYIFQKSYWPKGKLFLIKLTPQYLANLKIGIRHFLKCPLTFNEMPFKNNFFDRIRIE